MWSLLGTDKEHLVLSPFRDVFTPLINGLSFYTERFSKLFSVARASDLHSGFNIHVVMKAYFQDNCKHTFRGERYYSVMDTLGKRARWARIQAGLSQEALAALIDTTHTTIGNIEKDKHDSRMSLLFGIARETKVSLNWLLTGIGDAKEGGMDSLDLSGMTDQQRATIRAVVDSFKEQTSKAQ